MSVLETLHLPTLFENKRNRNKTVNYEHTGLNSPDDRLLYSVICPKVAKLQSFDMKLC